ncbi:MAG: lauroyl acyltransferase [Desulfobacteraceae bacterium 4572_88]|nr:MAG: lauroyl acyltransferase [Desulfobacteraceae bacterium 4572_88]
MSGIFYNFITLLSRHFGPWVFMIFAWIVATGYFLFSPTRVAASTRFYRVLFPDKSSYYHIWCTWKQYHNFTSVFLDRFLLQDFDDITYTSEGWEHLEDAVTRKTGGILLMSHMGNWEVAAHLLRQKQEDMRLLLYMGIRHKEQIERIQKQSLCQSGIKIIAVDQDAQSPFDLVEGIRFLRDGGLVSMTGDITWKSDQRVIRTQFLGHEVLLPEVPHVFALLSGAPIFFFFTFRTGKKQYHFTASQPVYVRAASRSRRTEAIHNSAQVYATALEKTLRQHPFEWYHFESFLGKTLEK